LATPDGPPGAGAGARGGGHDPERALADLGVSLPPVPAPLGVYLPARLAGDLLFTSGVLPVRDGIVAYTGRVGDDLTPGEGAEAARLCAVNAVAALADALGGTGGLRRVAAIVQVTGHVCSAPDFFDQPAVLNGASEWLAAVFGDAGRHTRLALGALVLPKNAAVELALIVRVRPA
jgi:enamine deaminase RidA (YjgF/YER057c/UK114 family)